MVSLSAVAAVVVAVVCGALALLHLLWATGSRWPAHDDKSLFDLVVGAPLAPPGRAGSTGMPSAAACVVVAVALVVAGGCVVVGVDVVSVAVAVAFAGRGVVGFFDTRLRPATIGTRFERMNRVFYSPLCLVLAALTVVSMVAR